MNTLENVQVGDFFALVTYRRGRCCGVTKVTIAKITKTTATDTKGRHWSIRTGSNMGGSEWDRVTLQRWTSEHDALVENRRVERRYEAAMASLGANGLVWSKVGDVAAMASALPHLESAVKALKGES